MKINPNGATDWFFSHWAGKVSVRSQNFRLDAAGNLFDMVNDSGQTIAVNEKYKEEETYLLKAKKNGKRKFWQNCQKLIQELFQLGILTITLHKSQPRDMKASGGIKRSSVHPNDSFFITGLAKLIVSILRRKYSPKVNMRWIFIIPQLQKMLVEPLS